LLWASGVRILQLHHVTFAVDSVGHMFRRHPFRTRDGSTAFAPLTLLSCGDSWHNAHHAYPGLARHGIDGGQIDSSALLIRLLERLGCASDARWPTAANTARRRTRSGRANQGGPSTENGAFNPRVSALPSVAKHTGESCCPTSNDSSAEPSSRPLA
jgi:stearoyl-CoA desaturase (delta-9 desaturase)